MKQLKLNIQSREATGTAASQRIRREGRVPAVIYGESGSRQLTVDAVELRVLLKAAHGGTALLELVEEGVEESQYAVIKEIQREVISQDFLHVDLHEVVRGKPMTADVAVHLIGTPAGVKAGGVLEQHVHEVTVRCRPRYLPEFVEVDVSALGIAQVLKAGEIKTAEEIELIVDPELDVAGVVGFSAAAEESEAEEAEEA
jgi:large subunit ribosomal protein L25